MAQLPPESTQSTRSPDAAVVVTPLQLPKESIITTEPHIALVLPLLSRDFSRAADTVREGMETAAAAVPPDTALPIRIYPLDNEKNSLPAIYQQAIAMGARCVVAGLTRDGAATLATLAKIKTPTLVLNQVDAQSMPSGPFYTLTLSLDDEARQVAKLIADQGLHQVAIVTGPSSLSKRIHDAFEKEWVERDGEIINDISLGRDGTEYAKLRSALQGADSIFLAAEVSFIRQVIPFVARGVPIFATSQVNDRKTSAGANTDLQDIRFLDMPWLVEPTHLAVAIYPRSTKAVSAELDRLYALGIDAYRLAYMITAKNGLGAGKLDGVTGDISLRDGHRFQRELLPAYFDGGQVMPLKSTASPQ